MQVFRFAAVLHKHMRPYTRVRPARGAYDEDGEWREAPTDRQPLCGHVQPLSERLKAREGGDYRESDRMLYTTHRHESGELLEYDGVQYRVAEPSEREYSDIQQYVIRKVVVHDPVS